MAYSLGPTTGPQYAGQVTQRQDGTQQIVGPQGAYQPYTTLPDGSTALYWGGQSPWQQFMANQPQRSGWGNRTQTVPGANQGNPGTASAAAYTPPPPAAGSATATNPFLNLGLNAFTNTQGPYDPTWLQNFGQSLWNKANQNWSDTINPTLNSQAISAGGFGGDRSAIAEGVMKSRLNENVFNALAPVALQDYNSWQNRALQGGQAAAGVGTGLEGLDLNRMLGIGQLQNSGRALDISQQNANTSTAQQAANSAGVPTYTNPLSAGVGGALGIAQLLKLIFG